MWHNRRTRVKGLLIGWSKNKRDNNENRILNFEEEVTDIDIYDGEDLNIDRENNHAVNKPLTQEEVYYSKNSFHDIGTYNDIEPLSKNDIQQVFNMIVSNYEHCTKEVQYIIRGLEINI